MEEQLEETQSLQNRIDDLNRLVQVSLVMNSTLALDPLLKYIMRSAAEICGAESASILLMDDNTRQLVFTASIGDSSEELIGMVVPLDGSIAGAIVKENRALIIDDAEHDPRHFGQIDDKIKFHTQSLLGVPMRIKDKLIGVIEVLNKREGRFTEEDVRHITILASQAAVAIENSQLITELKDAYAELESVNQLKNDFIAIASHELRTPLGVILGYASFLKEDITGEASEHAEMVMNSAIHLSNLIEDMTNLRYVRIESSELNIRPVHLKQILQEAYGTTLKLAEAKEQGLVFEPPRQAMIVMADFDKSVLALTNILNNAVKFTPQKGVILLSAIRRGDEAWIMVKDNGTGLEEDQLERVFDQFYQVEDHMVRTHNGLGLGLTIAQAIVQKLDGRIWVESPGLDMGSTFWFSLPLVPM